MSDQDAMAILIQRRGSMYDPLIVDTFIVNLKRLTSEIEQSTSAATTAPRRMLVERRPTNVLPPLGTQVDILLSAALEQTNAKVGIVFAADRDNDCLTSVATRCVGAPTHSTISMPLGYGVSGWVATNGTPAVNAEASLDFLSNPPTPGLVRSLCVPVRVSGQVAGVFSLYTDDPRGFNDEDRASLERLSSLLAAEEGPASVLTMLREKQLQVTHVNRVH
jgi:signal transduction protein with GAF and PtsI domain